MWLCHMTLCHYDIWYVNRHVTCHWHRHVVVDIVKSMSNRRLTCDVNDMSWWCRHDYVNLTSTCHYDIIMMVKSSLLMIIIMTSPCRCQIPLRVIDMGHVNDIIMSYWSNWSQMINWSCRCQMIMRSSWFIMTCHWHRHSVDDLTSTCDMSW